MGGTVDGDRGDQALLAPPYTAQANDIAEIVGRFGEAVDTAIASLRARSEFPS